MPRGDWSERFAPKLIVAAFVGLFIIAAGATAIVSGLLEQAKYVGRSYERSAEYAADTYGPAYDSCIRLSRERQANCVAEANGKRRENERNEQDLIAQQTAAVWTFLMGCAAIIGMMLSALGVFLVWTTFRETRKSNDLTAQFQRARLQAKIKIHDWPGGDGYDVVLKAENIGASVATAAIAIFNIFADEPPQPPERGIVSHRHTISPGNSASVSLYEPRDVLPDGAFIAGSLTYNTVLGGPHVTYFCFKITPVEATDKISGRASRAGIAIVPASWPADT